jgi:translation initiation factor IF-2
MNRQDMDTSISAALSTGELQDQSGESGAFVRAHSSAGCSSGPGGSPQNAGRVGSETLSPPSGGGGPLADESDDASAAGAAEPLGRQSPAVSTPLQGAPTLQLAEHVPPDAGLLLPGRSASLGVSSEPAEHRSSPRAPSMPALSPRVTSASSRAASQSSKAASSASPPPAAPSERSQGAGEDGAARPPLEQSGVKRAASVHAGAAAPPPAGAPPQPGARRPQSAGTAARGGAPLGAAPPWAPWGGAGDAASPLPPPSPLVLSGHAASLTPY